MKSRTRAFRGVVLAAAFIGLALWFSSDPFEPRVGGRRDSQAIFVEIQHAQAMGPAPGASVLDTIGPDRYVRALLKLYHEYRPSRWGRWRDRFTEFWWERFGGRWPGMDRRIISWRRYYIPSVETVQDAVVRRLPSAGPAAAPAVETLVRRLDELSADVDTVRALGAIGPAASPAMPALRTVASIRTDPWYLTQLADTLGRIEPGSQVLVIPGALPGLTSPDERIRAKSAELLGRIGPSASASAPQIRELLEDRWSMVRAAAAKALESIEGGKGDRGAR